MFIYIFIYLFIFSGTFKKFEDIQGLDDDYCPTLKELLLKSFTFNPGIGKTQPEGIKNIRIAGSVAEASAIARLFQKNHLFSDCRNREIEADYEYILFEIPES